MEEQEQGFEEKNVCLGFTQVQPHAYHQPSNPIAAPRTGKFIENRV